MRPKKKVLLVDSDLERLQILRFTLDVHRYAVSSATTCEEVIEQISKRPEVVIYSYPYKGANIDQLLNGTSIRSMALCWSETEWTLARADCVLLKYECVTEILLERLKLLTVRKRGPQRAKYSDIRTCSDMRTSVEVA